jgi:hypothetical protein
MRTWLWVVAWLAWVPMSAGADGLAQVGSVIARSASPSAERMASGLAFGASGRAFFITAESRIFPGESYAHEIRIAGEPTSQARYVASDPGLGLALLEIRDPSPRVLAFPLPQAAEAPAHVGERVRIAGVTGSSAGVSVDDRGQLLTAESDRHAIPSLRDALEVLGAPLTTGQVGSVVLSTGGAWLGMVSDQFLALRPGEPTHLGFWEMSSTELQGHVLGVPAAIAAQWARSVLEGRFKPAFHVDPQDRAEGVGRITSGQLVFEEACPPLPTGGTAAVDPNYPIGGADGAGIGGQVSTGRACKLRISLAAEPAPLFAVPSHQAWHDRVVADLRAHPGLRAEAWYLTSRDLLTGRPVRWVFGALPEFFRDLGREGLQAVTLYRPEGTGAAGTDPELAALRRKAAETARLVAEWLSTPTSFITHESAALTRQVYFEAVTLQSEAYAGIGLADLDYLLDRAGPFKTAWGTVEAFSAVGARIHPALAEVRAELARLHE